MDVKDRNGPTDRPGEIECSAERVKELGPRTALLAKG